MSGDNRSPPIQRGFSDFLAEPIGLQENGMQLSLLSALTRLGLDPWEEAARLARMPMPAAAEELAAAIRRLPAGDWKPSDTARIAIRLIGKLPGPNVGTVNIESIPGNAWRRLAWPAAVGVAVLVVLWMLFMR